MKEIYISPSIEDSGIIIQTPIAGSINGSIEDFNYQEPETV